MKYCVNIHSPNEVEFTYDNSGTLRIPDGVEVIDRIDKLSDEPEYSPDTMSLSELLDYYEMQLDPDKLEEWRERHKDEFIEPWCIVIPRTVRSMVPDAFSFEFRGINSIYYEGPLHEWCAIDRVQYCLGSDNVNEYEFYYRLGTGEFHRAETIHISSAVEAIPSRCFCGCNSLSLALIFSEVIGQEAFFDCHSLKKVYLAGKKIEIQGLDNEEPGPFETGRGLLISIGKDMADYILNMDDPVLRDKTIQYLLKVDPEANVIQTGEKLKDLAGHLPVKK